METADRGSFTVSLPDAAQHVVVRRDPVSERWEQSFSDDGGETWETNWTVEHRRPDEVQKIE